MHLVAAYDISAPRRLTKVARIMKDYGERIQYSIFEMEISPDRFTQLVKRVSAVLDPDVDGVKYFEICERCLASAIRLGRHAALGSDEPWTIL
ncbi:CRISPR-associated endonuclease Cas2 [Desulfolutivibrio sulfoxidireducens]|uniref:CRISPR-associated endonuclease Cas2 n=1 Tax=Desulfolutivibrio sulfoxidireducens TaxID=2773299 RepID=UPI00159E34FE|nr:CRISPR-associated endonuclease Cas2 [Desulfolutivibrio sulfoxidireducens]QLA19340.1 CRISPR-associated endonuclease Cas2 [Desulfolutivibrio sulfoxidireducens]